MPVASMLDKFIDKSGSSASDELIYILHQDNFNLSVFMGMVESRIDFEVITQDVIDGWKES